MSMPPPAKLMTADEFEAFIARPENRQRRFQLMHGELVWLYRCVVGYNQDR